MAENELEMTGRSCDQDARYGSMKCEAMLLKCLPSVSRQHVLFFFQITSPGEYQPDCISRWWRSVA